MDTVPDRPVTLPHPHPTTSYWQTAPSPLATHRTTPTLPSNPDIIIIGSGISGATLSHHLLTASPSLHILLLESRLAASGASGRNGGHTKHASYRTFPSNLQHVGASDAKKIARLEFDCMRAVHSFVRSQGIECDAHQCDTVDVYYSPSRFEEAKRSVELMKREFGRENPEDEVEEEEEEEGVLDYEILGPDRTEREYFTPGAVGAVKYEAGSLSAYKFTVGVLGSAVRMGLNLQTQTPVLGIRKEVEVEEGGGGGKKVMWTVVTDRGTVSAPKLVLATNGYTARLYPKVQGVIVPYRGVVTAQRPGNGMPQRGLPTTYSFVYEKGYDYMISRQEGDEFEGDIVIGGGLTKGPGDGAGEFGNTDDTAVDRDIERYLNGSLVDFFGQNWGEDHPEGRVRQCWSGVMGYSADGYPLVGEVPGDEGLYLDASFQGHGMVLCFLCAKAVSEMILGRDGEELDRWFPKCFRVSERRMGLKFKGQHHVPHVDGEEKSVDVADRPK